MPDKRRCWMATQDDPELGVRAGEVIIEHGHEGDAHYTAHRHLPAHPAIASRRHTLQPIQISPDGR